MILCAMCTRFLDELNEFDSIQQKYRTIKISSLPVLVFLNLQYTALQWLNVLLLLVRDNEHTPKTEKY